jgi:hypothetical protein
MGIPFKKAKSMDYQDQPPQTIGFQGNCFYKPSTGKQPDYIGTGTINFKGEVVPVEIAVWQNTKSIKIIGTKK